MRMVQSDSEPAQGLSPDQLTAEVGITTTCGSCTTQFKRPGLQVFDQGLLRRAVPCQSQLRSRC